MQLLILQNGYQFTLLFFFEVALIYYQNGTNQISNENNYKCITYNINEKRKEKWVRKPIPRGESRLAHS